MIIGCFQIKEKILEQQCEGYDKETFLFDLKLGIVFDEIDKIIKNAYQLSDFDKHKNDCIDIAQNI